ncbi:MAG: CoB--CoM heterodisulfide reductase subunit B [Hadesarchaea archaeon]|nr:MAG: CoB--CoM heterodisulfide reductase subunit B [Hadesarchaea archaeon]
MVKEEYAFYLGCITPNRYPGIEAATRKVFERLGIKLRDMEGASCCPAPGVVGSFDALTWLLLGARNLSIAEGMGLDILTVCNGCFDTLFEVNRVLREDVGIREKVNEILASVGRKYSGTIGVHHFTEVLRDYGLEGLKQRIKRTLDLRVAVHYGCHLLRPSEHKGIDDPLAPRLVDELVEVLGCKSVDYPSKLMCCGAGGGVRSAFLKYSLEFTRRKLKELKEIGVDCIVDVCSFCHLQFDRGQKEIENLFGEILGIPVVHYSQLLGLAMGMSPSESGMDAHAVSCESLLRKLGLQ